MICAGLEVLICNKIWRDSPMPCSIRALRIHFWADYDGSHDPSHKTLGQVVAAMRRLPALEHVSLTSDNGMQPHLASLLEAVHGCALTHLSLTHGKLRQFPAECSLPASLKTVNISFNDLLLAEWLPRLAKLPFCHTLDLWPAIISGEAAIQGGLDQAPALRLLRCESQSGDSLPELAAARAAKGLAAITVVGANMLSSQPLSLLSTPAIQTSQCALLPNPKLLSSSQ